MIFTHTDKLAQQLVRIPSVTPVDRGCQKLIQQRLEAIGFIGEYINFGDVSNLWITRGKQKPLVVFAGHTDVVPTGSENKWRYPPFSGQIENGYLYGRGAADMKGSIASFVTACERFIQQYPEHKGCLGLLITSDEEGPAKWGTKAVIAQLQKRKQHIDMCIVGEPTSVGRLGDTIKTGRRGSLNGTLTIFGKQGHIAYPHLADNPLHNALPALNTLTTKVWDQGNEQFQPTCFQISNINGGIGASNVIPGEVIIKFNFRFSPESTASQLKQMVENTLKAHNLECAIKWSPTGSPFWTPKGSTLVESVINSVKEITNIEPVCSTSGGTSDGRFIAPSGSQVVELGPINASIHQIDENTCLDDLNLLSECYQRILEKLLL